MIHSVLLSGLYPDQTIIQKYICTSMLTAALFTIAKDGNNLISITDDWVNKMWYIGTMEYYSAIKQNGITAVLFLVF